MSDLIRFIAVCLCMGLGLTVYLIGIIGIYRFGFVLNRMHAAAILDTAGLFFLLLGLILYRGFDVIGIKLLLIFVFLWLTGPISSHLIANLEYRTDRNLKEELDGEIPETERKDGDRS